jgi:hypothetical protein
MEPRIQYAQTSDGVGIAYWTLGDGMPVDGLNVGGQIPYAPGMDLQHLDDPVAACHQGLIPRQRD